MSRFDKYSRYYNMLYADKDYAAESQYVETLIRQFNQSAQAVLDLGCAPVDMTYCSPGAASTRMVLTGAKVCWLWHLINP